MSDDIMTGRCSGTGVGAKNWRPLQSGRIAGQLGVSVNEQEGWELIGIVGTFKNQEFGGGAVSGVNGVQDRTMKVGH